MMQTQVVESGWGWVEGGGHSIVEPTVKNYNNLTSIKIQEVKSQKLMVLPKI